MRQLQNQDAYGHDGAWPSRIAGGMRARDSFETRSHLFLLAARDAKAHGDIAPLGDC